MDRFLIVFTTGERLDFAISRLEQELYNGEHFPLFDMIESHTQRHGKETLGAKVYEVVEGRSENQYIHLTTFNS